MLHRAVTLTLLLSALPAVAPEARARDTLQAAGIPIVGRVLGPGGEPQARAVVHLEPIPPTWERAVLRMEGRPGPEPAATTRADADGTFELAAPEAGIWKVVVSAPGLLTTECRLIPLVEAAVLPAVELTPATDLAVRLVDSGGKPLPGAVGAFTLGLRDPTWRPQLRLAAAGEDGIARLPLGKGEKIQLEVLAEGHPLVIYEVADESSVTITVPAGVAGTVRVTDRRKRPLAGAVAFQGSALLPLGRSDGDGRLPLVLQAEEEAAVKVVTADRSNGSFELDLAKTRGETKDLALDPPAVIRGRVFDLASRDPVAGALVWAVRGELVVTDARGSYALDVGVYTSRWVQAAAAGYQKGHSQLGDDASGDAPAIALAPAATLSGRVIDGAKRLLEGVEIALTVLPRSGDLSSVPHRLVRDGWRGRTSRRGAFQVAGLPAGVGFQLRLEREGFAPRTVEVAPLEPFESRTGLEVVLEPGRLAFGRVVDEGEVPIAGAEVVLQEPPPTDDPRAMMRMRVWRRADEAASGPAHLTDGEGRFEIADLAPGRYDLEVRAAGFAKALVPGVRVVEDARRVDLGTVILVPGASIEGRVTDADGGAIAGAEVTVDAAQKGLFNVGGPAGGKGRTTTDATGRFVVADLTPGQPVTVTVTREGYGSAAVRDLRPPTEEPLAIVLEPAASLKGRVVDRRGDPIPRATVSAHPDYRVMTSATMAQQRRPAWARTGADGRFLIAEVEPGTLQVSADAESYQQKVLTGVEVKAGAELELELVLERGAVVEGTVTTADGEPVVQAFVNVSEPVVGFSGGHLVSASSQTDVEGRYRVDGAPTGPASITVHQDNRERLKKTVEVRPGTNVVDLVLEQGFEVRGQVVAPDGTPVVGAHLSIQEARMPGMTYYSSGSPQAVSRAGGAFSLSGIVAGRYTVSASREGYAPAQSEAFEVSGDVSGLLLELRRGATLKGRVLGLELDELGSLTLIAVGQQGGMRQGRVDFSAEYAFDSLAPGRWHLQAQVAGSGRSLAVQVEIPEGVSEVEKDLEFGTGYTLTGVVLDGGQPLAGANVNAGSATGSSGHATTGADGRFRIENLPAGSYFVVVMAAMGLQHNQQIELAGDHELRIELSTGSLSGVVRDATSGEPVAGAAIVLERLDADDDPFGAGRFGFGGPVNTDSRGVFRAPKVRQGTWRVVATKAGYGPGETTAVVAGGAAPELEIRLVPTEGVTFEVALASGVPLQDVQVAILDPSGRPLTQASYPVTDGRVRVPTVPAGRWDLAVQGGDSAVVRLAVTAPGEQGRLVLPAGGTLHVTVPELEEVPIARVSLTGPDGRPFVSTMPVGFGPGQWVLYGGQSTVPGLAPGVWTLTVEHEGRTWSGSATVTPGATTAVHLP